MFVPYCTYQASVLDTLVPKFARCPSGTIWYKNRQKYHKRNSGYIPKRGDAIFFYNDELGRVAHTGIVVNGDENYVTTIKGSTTIDAVKQETYNRSHSTIDGYDDNGEETIKLPAPPIGKEINEILVNHYKELLDACYIILPPEQITLSYGATIPMPPNDKALVEVSADTTIFDNSINNPNAVTFDMEGDIAMSQEIALSEAFTLTFGGSGLEDVQNLADIVFDINMSLDTGAFVMASGIRTGADEAWFYIPYAIREEVQIADGYPPVSSIFKYTLCLKSDDSAGARFFELVEKLVAEYRREINMAVDVAAVIGFAVAFETLLLAGDISGLIAATRAILRAAAKVAIVA